MNELHLKVYKTRSELVLPDGSVEVFQEGSMSPAAQKRYKQIEEALSSNYLENKILACRDRIASIDFSSLKLEHKNILDRLVRSITSDSGRALVALTILQLCIKSIEPKQNIRLHKGSRKEGKDVFSWSDGVSMRVLGKKYIVPVLRKHELLKLNADGFMMTRSLAENYPYSEVYKAKIKGARFEWIQFVEAVERDEMATEVALQYILSQLLNQAEEFQSLSEKVIRETQLFSSQIYFNRQVASEFIFEHINQSDYAARLMEIAMHSLMQAMENYNIFSDRVLQLLSQMRSANKKHKNIGDIELLENDEIIESWDAKYGKAYLRDEIEELSEKLEQHPQIQLVGLVTSMDIDRVEELQSRCEEIEDMYGIKLELLTFYGWVEKQFERSLANQNISEQELAIAWIQAYTESLAQKRRDIAPIDEPCYRWLLKLDELLLTKLQNTTI